MNNDQNDEIFFAGNSTSINPPSGQAGNLTF